MLRVFAIWALLFIAASVYAADSPFLGKWRGYGADEKVVVHFRDDGTFRMITRGWMTPPVLDERGRWRVHRKRLLLHFRSKYRPGPFAHIVLPILSTEPDKIRLRSADRKTTITLDRVYDLDASNQAMERTAGSFGSFFQMKFHPQPAATPSAASRRSSYSR